MVTIFGAKAVGFDAAIGSIETGKKADLTVVDIRDAFVSPIHDPVSALIYSALGHEVRDVVIDGVIVMRDRNILTADQEGVRKRAQQAAAALTGRAGINSRGANWCSPAGGA